MDRIYVLLQRVAEKALELVAQDEVMSKMERAGMPLSGETSSYDDPILINTTRRAIRLSIVHWLNATIENPQRKVDPFVTEIMLKNATAMADMGIPELMFSLERTVQNAAWEYWMGVAFEIIDNPGDLKEVLEMSFESITTFVEESGDELKAQLKEYAKLNLAPFAINRKEVLRTILEGRTQDVRPLINRLEYNMNHPHVAAIIWSESASIELKDLESLAKFFAESCGAKQPLIVPKNNEVVWLWANAANDPNRHAISAFIDKHPGTRISYSTGNLGVEGFRRAHLDALKAQRVLGRLRSESNLVSYEDLRLIELASTDPEKTNSFISNILGELSNAAAELRLALLTYIESGCNYSLASERLYIHRNTVIQRVKKAESLLPNPLAKNLVQVASALELGRWLG